MWTLRVTDDNGTIWDETTYGGNSVNKLSILASDLKFIVEHPEDLAGNIVTLTYDALK